LAAVAGIVEVEGTAEEDSTETEVVLEVAEDSTETEETEETVEGAVVEVSTETEVAEEVVEEDEEVEVEAGDEEDLKAQNTLSKHIDMKASLLHEELEKTCL